MKIYKELSFIGDMDSLCEFKKNAHTFVTNNWYYTKRERNQDWISFDYLGDKVETAEVLISCGLDSLKNGCIKIDNIIPLSKAELSVGEYNRVLDLFYEEIIAPNKGRLQGIEVIGPESDVFDPLKYISEEALHKLVLFCNNANKSTGSSYERDEERWFDFICQTVEDGKVFDCDTLFHFLMDEEFWGRKETGFIGVIGHFAWSEDKAAHLALEYENYVRILRYYIRRKEGQ